MPATSLRVLILENQSFQRAIAVKILRQLGCGQIFEAASGNGALTLLERCGPVDLVICDVRMEGMDGLEFIHRAAESALIGSVILSSGVHSEVRRSIARLVERLGGEFLGDVGKPLNPEAMRDALERARPRQAANEACEPCAPEPKDGDVRRGLAYKEFVAHYLPRCNLGSGDIEGVDVVARWHHPTLGVLDAAHFMPLVERLGLRDELLVMLLEQGLELQRSIQAEGGLLRMSFSLALTQLHSRSLTRRIKSLMHFHRCAGNGIVFELILDDRPLPSAPHLENLIRLRMLGCGVGLGRFGSAGAALLQLCHLPFSEIRLASALMAGIERQPRQRGVLKSTLALASSLGLGATVSGVECATQHLLLMDMGCMIGQGSYFSPVLTREELLRRLAYGGRGN